MQQQQLYEGCFLVDLTIPQTQIVSKKFFESEGERGAKGMKRELEENRKEWNSMKGEGRKRREWKKIL